MEPRRSYRFPFSRYPAVRIVLLLIAGILLFYFYEPSLVLSVGVFTLVVTFFLLIEWLNKQAISVFLSDLSSFIFILMIISFGVFLMAISSEKSSSKTIQLIDLSPWEEVEIKGKVRSISTTAAGKIRWDVLVEETVFEKVTSSQSYKIRVLADELSEQPTLGDQVIFSGTLIPISEKRNPRDFDYKSYLKSQGISAQIKAKNLNEIIPNNELNEWVWWREKALALVDKNFEKETAPIAKALLVGYKQDLDSESKTAFARAGLSHIMAVSGLHVGFIVAPFWIIIPYFWTKRYGSIIGLGLLILLLICYAGITGFSPSVMRASVMAGFLSYGKLFYRVNNSINLTAAAAIVLLIIDPAQLFEIGFQLSFSAVLIILLILPVIQNMLPYWVRIKWYGKPLMVVIVSLVVQFGLYPLQVYYFGEISLVSPIANALFVPLLGIVVPLSLIALFATAIFPLVGLIINYPSSVFLGWMSDFVNTAATWDWAWTTASLESSLIFVLWLFVICTVSAWQISALRWKLSIGVLATACLMLSLNTIEKLQPAKLVITFFDVGQGDAALLSTPSGKHILIDAGVWSPGYSSGRSVIVPHLSSSGIKKLDAIILSHPHADHIGGIMDLMESMPINVIYNSGYEYDSDLYHAYQRMAREKSIPIRSLRSGDSLALDPAMLFLVLGPDGIVYNSDPNEHSLVMNIIYGETEFLFTGDAGEDQEERLVHKYGDLLDTDVLKVGHHGSRTSSGFAFLKQVTPEMAMISLAESNRFRHPHKEALYRLSQTKAELLFTSRERAVILESDGETIKRVHWQ
ncbi:MAG TPA: DNA internalization-related competence protein ComEC/Rec2 [Gracilimonas sp.]|uniref:DNA internalization-related competence protein ComEC/Rec2 n=1 Tax=Gracilimonas sp. TaxID=1974203 RepID=UPI002DA0A69C|nr:DNA internalization-related competence protein ComEC/Rec2 [Gracilimonas sp.]